MRTGHAVMKTRITNSRQPHSQMARSIASGDSSKVERFFCMFIHIPNAPPPPPPPPPSHAESVVCGVCGVCSVARSATRKRVDGSCDVLYAF